MQKLTDPEKAAAAYLEYLQEMQANSVSDRDEEGKAHLFLANFNYNKKDFDVAYKHAFKCLEYPEVIGKPISHAVLYFLPEFIDSVWCALQFRLKMKPRHYWGN